MTPLSQRGGVPQVLTVLQNADLFAPEPMGIRDLVVAAGSIVWIGERAELPAAYGAEVVDLGGRRTIPGLIDPHVHVTGGGGEAGSATKVPPVALSRFTSGGITTVIGVLGTDDCTRTTAELLAAVRGLRDEGLSAYAMTGGYHVPPTTLTGSVRGDIVHLDAVLGAGEIAISDHRGSQPTMDELLRLASETHVAGLMTGKAGILHLHLGDGARGLDLVRRCLEGSEIPARVFNPTHVNRRKALFDEARALAGRGCSIDVTAFPVEDGEDAWSADEALARYLESGSPATKITISSDGGGCLPRFDAEGRVASIDVASPGSLLRALAAAVARGLTLPQALPAFTSNTADLWRLARKGRLRPGHDADVVVLDGKGVAAYVMARGRLHVREGRVVVRGTFEGGAA
jgi:beta-aspartyl-dipeptidase (metallo-type)